MNNSVKISATIITFNEEKNIGRCIDSLKQVADEIIVVDSGSADQTEQICISKGVKFYTNAFQGHIEQKNYAVSLTNNPVILSLDADEALSEELLTSIKAIKENFTADGYYFNRLTNYCGKWIKHCGWYPDKKLRIWKKEKGIWGGTNPHDKVIMEGITSTQFLSGDLLHYSYYSIEQHLKQVNYFTDINAREAHRKNKRATIFHILFSPLIKFIKSYFFQLGILDGYYGFIVCSISAHATLYKYVKLRELEKGEK